LFRIRYHCFRRRDAEGRKLAARHKLTAFGIAPPEAVVSNPKQLWRATVVTCPRCASRATERVSEFGSTPCKAHYRCSACREPFDYFKCL